METPTSYRLPRTEVNFLRDKLPITWFREKLDNAHTDDRIFLVQFTSNEADEIQQALVDIFVTEGLQDDYEPNPFGIYIEQLIDIFKCDFEQHD
jgi:hypothetical protein